jgi:hypothetical protein
VLIGLVLIDLVLIDLALIGLAVVRLAEPGPGTAGAVCRRPGLPDQRVFP